MMKVAAFLALMLLCNGCQTLRVSRVRPPTTAALPMPTSTQSLPGLPFYIKKAACKHVVVWLEPIYTLTLEEITVSGMGKEATTPSIPRGSVTISLDQFRSPPVQDFLKELNTVDQTLEAVLKLWKAIPNAFGVAYTPTAFPSLSNRILISNTNEPDVYVDYSEPHYLNSRQPVAGTSKIDGKLAADGTLTEASAETENKTLETILSSLPIKEVMAGGLGFAAKAANPLQEKQLKLTTVVAGFKHTLSRRHTNALMPCPDMAEDVQRPYRYSRDEIPAAGAAPGKSKGKKITITGEIALPEEKSESPKKEDAPKL